MDGQNRAYAIFGSTSNADSGEVRDALLAALLAAEQFPRAAPIVLLIYLASCRLAAPAGAYRGGGTA